MADNVAITAGSGTAVATDEVQVDGAALAHVQFVKLVDGTANGTAGVPGTAQGLAIVNRRDLVRVAVNSGGLTIATTAYVAGDQMGSQFTIAGCAREAGGSGTIIGVSVTSAADITGAMDVVFSRASMTLAADNAAYAISDADALNVIDVVQLGTSIDIGNNRFARAMGLAIPYDCSGGTSLYAGIMTRVAHTFFAAVTDLQLCVWVERN